MKNLLLLLLAFVMPAILFAQEEEEKPDYAMVEHVYIHVKDGDAEAFEKAVLAHNSAHHTGDYSATLYQVATGPKVGTYIWDMGPLTMTDMDNRPSGEAHDTDWDENVTKYIDHVSTVEYWQRIDDLTNSPEGGPVPSMLTIWWIDVTRGEWYRFESFMENIKKIYEEKDEYISVWFNKFNRNDGRDAAIVWTMENWADFDDEWSMEEVYDEEFGKGAWDDGLEEWEECVKASIHEIWTVVTE